MTERKDFVTVDLLIFLSGLVLVFLANTDTVGAAEGVSRVLETLGLSMAGYAPIHLLVRAPRLISEWRARRALDEAFEPAVHVVEPRANLPIFIAADVEGCLTPPQRAVIDLRKFQRVRAYSEFVRADTSGLFPPIVIFTGRSQGYVELLVQALDLMDPALELPFVIENGCALYLPASRKTLPQITVQQRKLMGDVLSVLSEQLPDSHFEPKVFMVTLNPAQAQTIDDLRSRVFKLLDNVDLLENVEINSTASAVDVTPKGVEKLTGLEKTLAAYRQLRPARRDATLKDAVALVDSTSDLPVIREVGKAYCPAQEVHPEVRALIEDRFGDECVIAGRHIDFVIGAIQRETGLRLV
jgi:hydroxymethylpyrimidine pyrophosphatase-like HAD family hydrolase